MAFVKGTKNNGAGLQKKFGNANGVDENSNRGPTSTSKTIGITEGRYTFSKSKVSALDTGVWGVDTKTRTVDEPGPSSK